MQHGSATHAGTTMQAWAGTMTEPFVSVSRGAKINDDKSSKLVSTGRTFQCRDDLPDILGEVSTGVNFSNVSNTTTTFAKVDCTFD